MHDAVPDRLGLSGGRWQIKKCGNLKCGMIWLDPAPRPEDIGLAYRGYYTHGAAPQRSLWRRCYYKLRGGFLAARYGYQEAEKSSLWRFLGLMAGLVPHVGAHFACNAMWLRNSPGARLLEIGSGRGDQLAFFSRLGWDAEGLDFDEDAVNVARSRGLQVRCGSLQQEGLSDASYEAIVMSHVIEHLYDPIKTARECFRLLKPGGKLVVVTPNSASFGHAKFGENWMPLEPPRHVVLFNRQNLVTVVRGAGFSDVRSFTSIRNGHWVLGASAEIKRRGKFDFGRLSLGLKVYGFVLMYFEWILLFFSRDAGEEIIVIATK